LALRLSTGGNAVLDGNRLAVVEGRGVTVHVSVGITEAVDVPIGAGGVFVADASRVLVGTDVGGSGVDVRVQAIKLIILRIKIINFRLIG